MKKYLSNLLVAFMVLAFCYGQPNKVLADFNVNTTVYYQEIIDIVKIDKGEDREAKINEKFKQYENDSLYSTVDSKKSTNQENASYTYIVKRTPVSSRDDLLIAMGYEKDVDVSTLPQGQRCLLASYEAVLNQADRESDAYQARLEINLTDTTKNGADSDYASTKKEDGYNTKVTEPNIKKDFWPTSSTPVWLDSGKEYRDYYNADSSRHASINLSDVEYKYSTNKNIEDQAYTVVYHEYSHFLDNTKRDTNVDNYGNDGTHYKDEVTTPRMAFIEGWAQYNEMLVDSTGTIRIGFINACSDTAKLRVETTPDKNSTASYDKIDIADTTYKQLLSTECFNAYLLYRLASETVGEDAIREAFVATRWNTNRNITNVIQRLVKQNQDKAVDICKMIDEVFMGKLSDDSLRELVLGKYAFGDIVKGEYLSQKTKDAVESYISTRDHSNVNDPIDGVVSETVISEATDLKEKLKEDSGLVVAGEADDESPKDSIIIENESDNPFE